MTAQQWVLRTPDHFVFNVKAFRLFTGHFTETKVMHKDLQQALGAGRKLYYKDVPEDIRAELWRRFALALEPLRLAGKLGLVHFQFPPRLKFSREAMAHIERCIGWMPDYTLSIEFRHRSWWEGPARCEHPGLPAGASPGAHHRRWPQGADNSVPAVWETTHPDYLLLRLHGRNVETYNAPAQSAAERFDYDYPDRELGELAAELVRIAYKVRNQHAIFNNCDEDKGQRNGITFLKMLLAHG